MQHPENDGSYTATPASELLIGDLEKSLRRRNKALVIANHILRMLVYSGYCPSSGVIVPPHTSPKEGRLEID